MSIPGRRLSSRLIFSAAFCALTLSLTAGALAACVNDPAIAQKAAAFTTNPSSLPEGPNGPRSPDDVATDVQTFVASYPQALPAVLAILEDLTTKRPSTSALQEAIGTGLRKAANVCKTTDLAFALQIQGELAASGSPDANAQYAALTGNDPIGATTGSSGGVGDQTTATGGRSSTGSSFQTFAANSVSNNPTNCFSSSVSGAGSAGGTTKPRSSAPFQVRAETDVGSARHS